MKSVIRPTESVIVARELILFHEIVRSLLGRRDSHLAVNRDRVLAQMEGGVVYGLSMALLNEITVKNGAVVQNNFDDYPVIRLYQTPRIHVSIVDSNEPPTGVGEPPTPAVAPALANATAAAGGPRIREMPLAKPSPAEAKQANKVVFV
jgi:CO/xanthine dehydrogenase Mo-binding subunit